MDVRSLAFPDNFFDLAIDKSTIDALLCGNEAFLAVATMLKEVQRTIKVGGSYMAISYGTPENRLDHFKMSHLSWSVKVNIIGEQGEAQQEENNNLHYVYICMKNETWLEIQTKNWTAVQQQLNYEESSSENSESVGLQEAFNDKQSNQEYEQNLPKDLFNSTASSNQPSLEP